MKIKRFCIKCNKEICYSNYLYGSKMCRVCSCKERLKIPENNPMFGKKRPEWGAKYSGKNHPNWKGGLPKCIDCGKTLSNHNYKNNRCKKCSQVGVLNNSHSCLPEFTERLAGKYIRVKINNRWIQKHRYIAEQFIGRKLLIGEIVHHIDGNKLNNIPDNLYLFSNDIIHQSFHNLIRNKIIDRFILKSNLKDC